MDYGKLTSWKDITLKAGFVSSLIAAGFFVWMTSDRFVITPAEAAETHQQMIRWELEDVRRQIEDAELKKVETKYRAGLSPQAKDELAAKYQIKLDRLRNTERCLSQGRLRCD